MEETTEFVPVITDGTIADEAGNIYDLTKVVGEGVPTMLSAGIVITIAVLVIMLFSAIKKNGGKFPAFMFGILSYAYFGYIMYTIVMILLSLIPGVNEYVEHHRVVYLAFVMIITALLAVFGRYFSIKLLVRRFDTPGDALCLGIGYAAGNVLATLVNWMQQSSIVSTINSAGGIANIEGLTDPTQILQLAKQYYALAESEGDLIYQGLFLVLLVAFTVYSIVFIYAVAKKLLPSYWVWILSLIQAVLLFVNSLASYDYIEYIVAFVIEAVITIGILRYVFTVSKTELGDLLRPVQVNKISSGKGNMMKPGKKGHQQFPKFK